MSKARQLADNGASTPNRNMIINGAMNVAQRSTSVTGIGASDGYFTVDRFQINVEDDASAGRLTMTQTADGPSGFANCLKLDCTTADTSIAAGERLILRQPIEGQNLQRMKKGTSDAEQITISFYVKGNASATYSLSLYDGDNGRSISQTFAVTTSWNRIELTFAGDTTGAFGDDNAASLFVDIFLHAGTDFTGGTLGTSWASNDNATRAVGISSFFDATSRTFFITGYQMEIGSSATPFEHKTFAQDLEECKRYFQKTGNVSGNAYQPLTPYFDAMTTSLGDCPIPLRPKMRTVPSFSHSGVGELGLAIGSGTSAVSAAAVVAAQGGEDFIAIRFTSSDTLTQYRPMKVYTNNDATAFIAFDAEL